MDKALFWRDNLLKQSINLFVSFQVLQYLFREGQEGRSLNVNAISPLIAVAPELESW